MTMPQSFSLLKELMSNQPATTAGNEVIKNLKGLGGKHSVAVGLSGGVDSSLTAALLVEAGWHVEGLTLWLMSGNGSCCSDGLIDAAGICNQLGIPHHVMDTRNSFEEEIVQGLLKGYQEGITPIPCSRCNRSVKFSSMIKWTKENSNIERIATGHYARIRNLKEVDKSIPFSKHVNKQYQLLRGRDSNKDQSYFLYDLPQEILGKIVFPLGELTKSETREEAKRLGLRTAQKPESQDLCLAEKHGSMSSFLDHYLPPRQGEIVLQDGTVVGQHQGIEHFTIGQRKGLGVSWKEPLHVIKIESETNRIVVATKDQTGQKSCIVGEINWLSIHPPKDTIKVEVQVRYRSRPVLATLTPIDSTQRDSERERPYRCKICFKEKQFSITPGQAAVFYEGQVVLGGGIIQLQSL